MAYSERAKQYTEIERIRERPLVCYYTSSRKNAGGSMASDVIPEFAKQLLSIPKSETAIDILIVSNGGDPIVSGRIISMMREKFEKIGALLPFAAYSAATLLALGADEIVMHSNSNLGPVDPQLTYKRRIPGQPGQKDTEETIQFGSEDLRNFLAFLREDVGISDQEQLQRSFELVCKDVGSIPIGIAKRSSQLASAMGERLLSLHMKDQNKAKAIAEALNRSFYHHGYALGRKEAKTIGLPVKEADDKMEELLWGVWQNVESEMNCNRPFSPLEIVFGDPTAAGLIGPIQQIQLPANLPPQIMAQAIQQILNQIKVVSISPIDYELFQASVESTRCRSEFKTKGKINASRQPDMNIAVNVLKVSQGWEFHKS